MEAAPACSHMGGSKDDGGDDNNHDNNNHDDKNPHPEPPKQPAKRRTSKGKQKIEIKPIASERARLSTFSKRRSGIYKKANELSILCGAQVGVIGLTSAGRVFAYGSPSPEVIIQRCLDPEHRLPQRQGLDGMVDSIVEAHRRTRVENLNARYDDLQEKIEIELEKFNRLVRINSAFENSPNPNWLDIPDASDIPEEQLPAAAEELQDLISQVGEFRQMVQRPHIMMPPPAPSTAAPVNSHEEAPGQPLEAAAAAAPEIMNADNPSADLVAGTDYRADEVVDEEELNMFRFFDGYPSSPPGPF